jgi:hypothetical protein
MANPNLLAASNVQSGHLAATLSSTSATQVVSNAASSGKAIKVLSLYIANIDGTNACNVTVNRYPQAAMGGTPVCLASLISVPAKATLVVISADSPVNLLENESIGVIAAVANDLAFDASWEEAS